MKISSKMYLQRLAKHAVVTASTQAGWRQVRLMLVAHFDGLDTRVLKIGEWWAIQQAALAADARSTPAMPVNV